MTTKSMTALEMPPTMAIPSIGNGSHHHHHSQLRDGSNGQPLPMQQQQQLGAPGAAGATGGEPEPSAFYYGANAFRAGAELPVVPSEHHGMITPGSGPTGSGSKPGCASREACGLTKQRVLRSPHDRFVLISAGFRAPHQARSGGRWPIVVHVKGLVTATRAGDSPPPPPLIGLQRARSDREGPSYASLGSLLQRLALWILLVLTAGALLAISADEHGMSRMRLGSASTVPMPVVGRVRFERGSLPGDPASLAAETALPRPP